MLPQQIIAIIVIALFIIKLWSNRKKGALGKNEFLLWLVFWILAALAIGFIKQIDHLLASLGLSASGINFLIYVSVLFLFYFIFRLRLNISKMETEITELVRAMAIKKEDENK